MSRIKKLTLAVVGVFFLLAFFMSQKVQAQTELSGGGEFFNGDEEVTINLDIDHREEFNGWQYVIEGDIYYALEDDDLDEQTVYSQFKLNKDLDDKSYVLGVVQVDYDYFRDYDIRTVLGFGYGRKLYRSDKWKISNEVTVAYLKSDSNETILRNSLWISYMLSDRINITNKALYETSKEKYIRIETELEYQVTDDFSLSLSNEHTEDYEVEDILTFNFKFKF